MPLARISAARACASTASISIPPTSWPCFASISRMPVGLVTLISVTKPPMTSSPTNSMPRSRMTGPICAASQRSRSVRARLSALAPAARLPRWSPARGHAHQRVRHGLAVHQQDPGVPAGRDFGQVTLRDCVAAAAVGERLEYHPRVSVALPDDEDGAAAHAVERLEHGLAMLAEEGLHRRHVARDQGRCAAVREPGRVGLLVHVPQALRPVHDQGARLLCPLEQVGRVDVLHVEGRVLAHQHCVDGAELADVGLADAVPGLPFADDLERREARERTPVACPQVPLTEHQHLATAPGCGLQHGDRRILRRLDGFERVHQHREARSGWHQEVSGRLAGM